MKALETRESEPTQEVVGQSPSQPAAVTKTAEPVIEPAIISASATTGNVSNNKFVNQWELTEYYPYGLDYSKGGLGVMVYAMIYVFKKNLTVDIYVLESGEKNYFYKNRPYRLDSGTAIIEVVQNNPSALVYAQKTICIIEGNMLYIRFEGGGNPVAYGFEPYY